MLGKYLGGSYGIQKTLTFSIKTLNKTLNIFQIHKKKNKILFQNYWYTVPNIKPYYYILKLFEKLLHTHTNT